MKKNFMFPWGILGIAEVVALIISIPTFLFAEISHCAKIVWLVLPTVIGILCFYIINFNYPKPIHNKSNLLIILFPEDKKIEKLIKSNCGANDINSSLLNNEQRYNVVYRIPSFAQRYTFMWFFQRYIEKRKVEEFCKSMFFKYFIWKTKTPTILLGSITKRVEGEELYTVSMNAIYKCVDNEKSQNAIKKMARAVWKPELQFDSKREITGIKNVSQYIATVMAYIAGLSYLSTGAFKQAYGTHLGLFNDKNCAIDNRSETFKEVVFLEANTLYTNGLEARKIADLDQYIETLKLIRPKDAVYNEMQLQMLKAGSFDELRKTALHCSKIYGKLPHDIVRTGSMAYICLILGNYKKSEEYYASLFKKAKDGPQGKAAIKGIMAYCLNAMEKECEHPFANYLLGLIYYHYYGKNGEAKKFFNDVIKDEMSNDYLVARSNYYLKEIESDTECI